MGEEELAAGALYPPLTDIRRVSRRLATATARTAYEQELAREPRTGDLESAIAQYMYDPHY